MKAGLILVLFLAIVPGCSSQRKVLVESASQPQHAPAAAKPVHSDQPAAAKQPPAALLRKKVNALLEKKQYRQAMEALGRRHEGFEKEYLLAINGLLRSGDEALARGDHGSAAHAFKTALEGYPDFSHREGINRDQKQIKSLLATCVSRLMDQGLQEYRRGRLENAIRSWKSLLAVSPGDREAKMALETATVQLEALQGMRKP